MNKLFSIVIGLAAVLNISAQQSSTDLLRKLSIAEMSIANLYVEKVDEEKLVEDAIKGMLEKLDPHSSYATPKEVQQLNEPLQGSFEGIGVQFNMMEDTLVVIQTITKGPSEKVGIVAGDRIVSVNDTVIAGVETVFTPAELDSVTLTVTIPDSYLEFPNAFSPNGDGINDVFEPKVTGLDLIVGVKTVIFNRWGNILWDSDDPLIQWDGKSKLTHLDCPPGTYFYVTDITYQGETGEEKIHLQGSITIVR